MRVLILILTAALLGGGAAAAQSSGERGASILIFPQVVADASADTLLQLVNLSEGRVAAFCTYVDGGGGWQAEAGFGLSLLPDQTLLWSAARGRAADAAQAAVPAAPADFRGELLCVEVDGSGAPSGNNRLAGRATVAALAGGDVAAYAAVGLFGSSFNDGDEVLCIGGEPSDNCFIGAEYDPCPGQWILSHPADGAADGQLGAGSSLTTRITVAPCSQNVRDGAPGTVIVQMQVTNELEQRFSVTRPVTCWADLALADIGAVFTRAVLGTDAAQTVLRPAATSGGFAMIAAVERRGGDGAVVSRAMPPLHQVGAAAASDLIILPMGRP